MTPPPVGAPLLELTEVSRHYPAGEGTVVALDRVSLTVRQGEYLAIMGQSGSGKTTLMNLIGLLDRPSEGSYRVMGQDVAELDQDELAALRRDVFGFVFQRYNLIATATAAENVELPAIYAEIADELANQYTIGYVSKNTARDGAWRRVTVQVNQPGVVARTREGYYAGRGSTVR